MIKKLLVALAIVLTTVSPSYSALGDNCNFPTTYDTFTERASKYVITATDWNQIQCALDALQAAMGTSGNEFFVTGIQDEGSTVTFEQILNFAGDGVSCVNGGGKITCTITGGGGGSSIALDIANNGDDSTGITKIVTSATNAVFTESSPDVLYIDLSQPWPTATALATNPTGCDPGDYVTDIAADGTLTCGTPAGGGSSIIFDIGDDGGNDSTGVTEIATSGDVPTIFTMPSADKILIDVTKKWPSATNADTLSGATTNCSANSAAGGISAAGVAEDCTAYQLLDTDLTALGDNSTNGIWARTGSGTGNARTITASTSISVTNGDGVSGNPTIAFAGFDVQLSNTSIDSSVYGLDFSPIFSVVNDGATEIDVSMGATNYEQGVQILASDLPTVAVREDQANTYTTGAQDFGAVSMVIPKSTSTGGTGAGAFHYETDATNPKVTVGDGSARIPVQACTVFTGNFATVVATTQYSAFGTSSTTSTDYAMPVARPMTFSHLACSWVSDLGSGEVVTGTVRKCVAANISATNNGVRACSGWTNGPTFTTTGVGTNTGEVSGSDTSTTMTVAVGDLVQLTALGSASGGGHVVCSVIGCIDSF